MPGRLPAPREFDRLCLRQITDELVADLSSLTFGPPVTHVDNPLVYARAAWDLYCEKYGQGQREVLMIGMNPGPPGLSNPYEAKVAR